jgi:exonuclease SbcC
VDALSGQAHVLERQAAALQDAESRAGAARAALAASGAELAAAWNEARAAGGEDAGTAEPNRASATRSAAPALADDAEALATERLAALYQELQALDEPATRAAEQEAQRAAGGADASLRRLGEDAGLLAGRLAALAGELGRDVSAPAEGAAAPGAFAALLREACPELVDALPAREALDGELRALDQQAGNLERGREDARVALGDEPPKALDEAERALADLQLDHAARRRAQEIVSLTRQRMIEKVLPDTIANMCLLLPLLTAGRYRHAELTPDYRLQVWDERKRGYVEKTLYSGGTQDQFSLALRLGFALAALPRELGTSPGFLFLDEPLSSFDRDRTAALIELLTRGQITTFFQQVFLISHSQAFDPDQFSYHIVMEDGRVAHSTLP